MGSLLGTSADFSRPALCSWKEKKSTPFCWTSFGKLELLPPVSGRRKDLTSRAKSPAKHMVFHGNQPKGVTQVRNGAAQGVKRTIPTTPFWSFKKTPGSEGNGHSKTSTHFTKQTKAARGTRPPRLPSAPVCQKWAGSRARFQQQPRTSDPPPTAPTAPTAGI